MKFMTSELCMTREIHLQYMLVFIHSCFKFLTKRTVMPGTLLLLEYDRHKFQRTRIYIGLKKGRIVNGRGTNVGLRVATVRFSSEHQSDTLDIGQGYLSLLHLKLADLRIKY
jgi:hypothetical protein